MNTTFDYDHKTVREADGTIKKIPWTPEDRTKHIELIKNAISYYTEIKKGKHKTFYFGHDDIEYPVEKFEEKYGCSISDYTKSCRLHLRAHLARMGGKL